MRDQRRPARSPCDSYLVDRIDDAAAQRWRGPASCSRLDRRARRAGDRGLHAQRLPRSRSDSRQCTADRSTTDRQLRAGRPAAAADRRRRRSTRTSDEPYTVTSRRRQAPLADARRPSWTTARCSPSAEDLSDVDSAVDRLVWIELLVGAGGADRAGAGRRVAGPAEPAPAGARSSGPRRRSPRGDLTRRVPEPGAAATPSSGRLVAAR